MKVKFKLILVMAMLCIASSLAFRETDLDKSFIGYWKTRDSTARIVIFKDKDDVFQIVVWDSHDGEELNVVKFEVTKETIKTTEKTVSTNWTTYNTYSIVDENTLKCVVDGDGNGEIYFKRLK